MSEPTDTARWLDRLRWEYPAFSISRLRNEDGRILGWTATRIRPQPGLATFRHDGNLGALSRWLQDQDRAERRDRDGAD